MKWIKIIFLGFFFSFFHNLVVAQENNFVVKPYVQVGESPSPDQLNILWQTKSDSSKWVLEYRNSGQSAWKSVVPDETYMKVSNLINRKSLNAHLVGLTPGSIFEYHILRNGIDVFSSSAHALKASDQSYRIIAMGDIGAGTKEAKGIALQAYMNKPDLIVVPGDIVYDRGLVSDYDRNFWPVYNRENADSLGAPLMRSIPFVAAPGNHDTEEKDLKKYPDAQAYFYFWDQPLNGLDMKDGSPAFQKLSISDSARNMLIESSGKRFPKMANFSMDYGNSHWLVLDANAYVDWTNKEMTDWVRADLEKAKNAVWKFVLFHHPGFNSSIEHYEQQQMRLLSPLFEKGNVDVVFMGHVHNYQRSYPMRFEPDGKGTALIGGRDNSTIRGRVVNGKWTLYKNFDGNNITSMNGVMYIVTGAGGQDLYNPEQQADTDSWQKFTDKFISTVHSLSVLDINGRTFHMKQISIDGKEVDAFTIKK